MVIKIHMSLESHSTVESLHSYCPSSVSDSGSVQRSPLSTLHPSGLVLAEKRQRLTTTCRLDLYMFPFDKQICNITFSSVNYNGRFHQISQLRCCDPVIYFSLYMSCVFVEHELKLGTWRGGAFLTSVSEKLMITEGEWQLVNMSILVSSVGNDNSSTSKLIYMVRKKNQTKHSIYSSVTYR